MTLLLAGPHDVPVDAGLLPRLPRLLLRRDRNVSRLPRRGLCDCCGRPALYLRLVDPNRARTFAEWPYPADYLRSCATRENWFCLWCRRSYRMRMLASVIWPLVQGADVYQAGAFAVLVGGRASAPRSLTVSEYEADAVVGSSSAVLRHEDLQHLSFDNASFDLVVTSEILEHVADPWMAFSEIRRVLRPGGRHVFTVPVGSWTATRSREGSPEVFHMDGPDRASLVVTDFGSDLPDILRTYRFDTVVHEFPTEDPVTQVFESRAV